jgi:hypothetical protein
MNRRYLRATLVLILLAATFLAPPLSEVLCSDGCAGGVCEAPPPATVCDLDATGGCCGSAEPAEEFALIDPTTPQLTDACQLCPCFEADQIGNFVVPERAGKLKLHQHQGLASVPLLLSDWSLERRMNISFPGRNVHGPPLYQLHHALLI